MAASLAKGHAEQLALQNPWQRLDRLAVPEKSTVVRTKENNGQTDLPWKGYKARDVR